MAKTTVKASLTSYINQRTSDFMERPDDCLTVWILKTLFRRKFFCGWYYFCSFVFGKEEREIENEVITIVDRSVEFYVFCWSLFLSLVYLFLYVGMSPGDTWGWWLLLIVVYRLADMLAVIVYHNFVLDLDTFVLVSPTRTLSLLIGNYLEITIAFASLYVLLYCTGENFGEESAGDFTSTLITPLYFSFVTITTLGYGDFSPVEWPGQLLVVTEVGLGFLLLLIALQRVLAAKSSKPDRSCLTKKMERGKSA